MKRNEVYLYIGDVFILQANAEQNRSLCIWQCNWNLLLEILTCKSILTKINLKIQNDLQISIINPQDVKKRGKYL